MAVDAPGLLVVVGNPGWRLNKRVLWQLIPSHGSGLGDDLTSDVYRNMEPQGFSINRLKKRERKHRLYIQLPFAGDRVDLEGLLCLFLDSFPE